MWLWAIRQKALLSPLVGFDVKGGSDERRSNGRKRNDFMKDAGDQRIYTKTRQYCCSSHLALSQEQRIFSSTYFPGAKPHRGAPYRVVSLVMDLNLDANPQGSAACQV